MTRWLVLGALAVGAWLTFPSGDDPSPVFTGEGGVRGAFAQGDETRGVLSEDARQDAQMIRAQYEILKEQSLALIDTVKVLRQERQEILGTQQQLQRALDASQKAKGEVESQYVALAETSRSLQQDRRKVVTDQTLAQKMIKSLEKEVEVLKRRQAQLEASLQRTDAAYRAEQATLKEASAKLGKMQAAVRASEENSMSLQLEVVEAKSLAREGRIAFNYELGRLYAKHGEYDAAITEFQKTLKVDPTYADAYRQLGEIYREHLMRADLASPYFQRYIELRPEASDFGQVKGWLIKQKKEIELHREADGVGGGFFHNLARIFW